MSSAPNAERVRPWHIWLLIFGQVVVSLALGIAVLLWKPGWQAAPQFIIVLELAALLPMAMLLAYYHVPPAQIIPLARPAAGSLAATSLLVMSLTVLLNAGNHIMFVYLPVAIQDFNPIGSLLENLQVNGLLDWGMLIVSMAIVPAVCEELFFRGLVQSILVRQWGPAAGITGASLIFALSHADPARFGVHLSLGLLFGYLCWRTGSVYASMLAHALSNSCALFLVNSVEAAQWLPLWLLLLGVAAVSGLAMLEPRQRKPLAILAAASFLMMAGGEALIVDHSPMIALVQAQQHINNGQEHEAIADLQHSIRLNPHFAPGYNYLAKLYATSKSRQDRRPVEAIRLASVAVELTNRRNVHFLATLARAYYEHGDYPKALSTGQETLGLNPDQQDARQVLIQARQQLMGHSDRR